MEAIPITELPEGATGRLVTVAVDDELDLQRLEVMGLCAGRALEIVRCGDPMIVRVLGTRIGLARSLARRASVHPHFER